MKVGTGQTLKAYLAFLKEFVPNKTALLPDQIQDELELHTPSELYNIGLHNLFEEKYDEALYYLENSIKTGKEPSVPLVAMFYEDGIVVDKNLKKAFKLYAGNMSNGFNSFRCGLLLFYGEQGIAQRKSDGLEMIMEIAKRDDLNSIHAKKFLNNLHFVDQGSEEKFNKKQNEKFVKSWGCFADFMMANNLKPSSANDWEKSFRLISSMKNEMLNEVEEEMKEIEQKNQIEYDKKQVVESNEEIKIEITNEEDVKNEEENLEIE
eukprot:gene6637-10802_t